MEALVKQWFDVWSMGNYADLPVTNNFLHVSPYGTIEGRTAYLNLVEANIDKFLGNQFVIHEALSDTNRTCVRYQVKKGDFSMEVSEWIYKDSEFDLISRVVSYYNIEGEISADRKLEDL